MAMANVVTFKSDIEVTDIFLNDQKSSESSSAMVKLICQNGLINVHRDILGARSPFLLELFKEEDRHITLADFDVRLVEKFCRLFYQGFTIVSSDKEGDDVAKIATILGCGMLKKSPATPQEIKASSSVKISDNDNEDGPSGSNTSGRDPRGSSPSRPRSDRNGDRSSPEDGKSDSNSNSNNCTSKKKKKGHRYEEECQNEYRVSSAEPSEDEEEITESEDGHDGFSGGRETRTTRSHPEPRKATRSSTQEQNETGPSRRRTRRSGSSSVGQPAKTLATNCYFCADDFNTEADLLDHLETCGKIIPELRKYISRASITSRVCGVCKKELATTTHFGFVGHVRRCFNVANENGKLNNHDNQCNRNQQGTSNANVETVTPGVAGNSSSNSGDDTDSDSDSSGCEVIEVKNFKFKGATLSARDALRIRQEAALKQQHENAQRIQFGGHNSELPINQNQNQEEETVVNDVQANQSSSIEKEKRKESRVGRVGPASRTGRPRILRSSNLELSDENQQNSTPGATNSSCYIPATNLEVQTITNNKDMQTTNNRSAAISPGDLKDLKKLFYCDTCYKQFKNFSELSECLWRHGFQKCLSCLQPVLILGSYRSEETKSFDSFRYFNSGFKKHCQLQEHYGPSQKGTPGLCCPCKGCLMYLPQELLWQHIAKEHLPQLDTITNSSYADHFEQNPDEYNFLYIRGGRPSTSAFTNVPSDDPNSSVNERQQRTTAKRTQPIANSAGPSPCSSKPLSIPFLSAEKWIEMIIKTINFLTEQKKLEPMLESIYQRVLYEHNNSKVNKSANIPNILIDNAEITKEQVEKQLEKMIQKGYLMKKNTDGSLIYTLAEHCKTYEDYLEYIRQKVEKDESEPNPVKSKKVKKSQPFSASTASVTINTNSNVANVGISSNSQNSTTSSTVTSVTDSNKDKTVTEESNNNNNNSITSNSSTLLSTPATTQQQSNMFTACLKKIKHSIEKRQHPSKRLRMQPAPLADSRTQASTTVSTATTTTSTPAAATINTNVTDTNATVINVTDTNNSTPTNPTATSSINSAAAPSTFLAPAQPATEAENEKRQRAKPKVNKKIAAIVSTAAKRTCKVIQPKSSSATSNENSTPDPRSTPPPQANAIETSSSSQQKPTTDSIETNKTAVQVATLVQPIELPAAGASDNQQTSSHQKPTESSESDAPPPKKKLKKKKVREPEPEPEPYLPVSTMKESMKLIHTRNIDGTISESYHCLICKANIEEKELAEDHDVYCMPINTPASPTPSLVSHA